MTSAPTPSGANGMPLLFSSSFFITLTSKQFWMENVLSEGVCGLGAEIREKGTPRADLMEEPEHLRGVSELPVRGVGKTGQ